MSQQGMKVMSEWSLVGKPALVVVHMQNSVVKAPSPLEVMGHCRATWEDGIVPRIQALQTAFRAKGHPVIFVVTYTPGGFTQPAYGPFWAAAEATGCNRWGTRDLEVIDELAPLQGERTVYNWPFGIFQKDRREENDLQQHLDELGVETIVLTGVATGMSVGHAAFTLADRFYNLIVPSDTCTDGNKQLHDAVMTSMIPAIALVTTADDVIAHL
jgi:nicotinamidase-related amidase